jgi:hypothetical protein
MACFTVKFTLTLYIYIYLAYFVTLFFNFLLNLKYYSNTNINLTATIFKYKRMTRDILLKKAY